MENNEFQYIDKYLRKILAEISCEINGTVIEENCLKIFFSNKIASLNLDVILSYLQRSEKEIKWK